LVCLADGGLWHSGNRGETWRVVLPAENLIHDVFVSPGGPILVASDAGLGWSVDSGSTWTWTTEGLEVPRVFSAVLDGQVAYAVAATGPDGSQAALYRGNLGQPLERCSTGLPESFYFDVGSGRLDALAGRVAFGTRDGKLFHSKDKGRSWELSAQRMGTVQAVRFGLTE
jgi:photosystem II stability/assembly factor-like uncharacterized protein